MNGPKSMEDFRWSRWIAPGALAAALLVLATGALLTFYNVNASIESASWVSHSREVLESTEGILADLSEAESAGRGFLLNGQLLYREQFDQAIQRALKRYGTLQQLTVDNADQQQRVEALVALIAPKTTLMQTFVAYRNAPEFDSAEEARMLDAGTQQMTAIRALVQEVQIAEDGLLAERVMRMKSWQAQTKVILLLSTLVSASVVLGTWFLLRRHWSLQESSAIEVSLHRSEKDELARYNQRLLESTGEGIYGIDPQGRCTFMNRAGALILGGKPKDFLGQNMHDLIHHTKTDGSEFPVEECPIYVASRTGDGCRIESEVFWRLDGKEVPVEYSSFPIKDREVVEGAVVTFNDISSRLRVLNEVQHARDAAEAANASKSLFLANMSHELRTPLNAVIMYSELLAEEAVDHNVPDFIPDLKRIRAAGKHLLELVNGVLDQSKVEAGKMELFPEEYDIRHLLDEVVTRVEPLIEKNENRIEVDVSTDVDLVFGDVTKVRQVLYNLLSNAGKFTRNGLIRLSVSRDAAEKVIVISVTDSGIGMTEEQVSRLFQPFMQADASTTRKYGGTGLGLAIIRRFTELMDGAVEVASVENQGTTFTVRLPERMRSPSVAAAAEAIEVITPATASGLAELASGTPAISDAKVVLIIDDDPAIRDILTRVLLAEGIRAVTASDGTEGLAKARECLPDLIILDVLLPIMDGWSVLTALNADEKLADIPVIMQSVKDDRDLGFMLGASEYLVKPVDRTKLVKLIQRHMRDDEGSVLVVDDDVAIRRALARTMEHEGWKVACAENGAAALNEMKREQPAVILLDLMMPEMDGFEFLDVLHENADWSKIPVIVLTALDLPADDRARLNGGVERILEKGAVSRHRLLDEVRRIVQALTARKGPQIAATMRLPQHVKANE